MVSPEELNGRYAGWVFWPHAKARAALIKALDEVDESPTFKAARKALGLDDD